MNHNIAKNVKNLRAMKHWTQQHLADTAGIQLRTVQRVEKGDGANLETLGALANAFDVCIDLLKADVAAIAEQLLHEQEEIRKSHHLVAVEPVATSSQLRLLANSDAHMAHCTSDDDRVLDVFATLAESVRDTIDLWDDVTPVVHRQWEKDLFGQIEVLRALGVVVCIGKHSRPISPNGTEIGLSVFYVVAWPAGAERAVVAVPK